MMRKRTRGTFRRVRLLKTFLISLIQVLYFHFLFWLLNVIRKGRDTLHQKTQPLQDIRNIWYCTCKEYFTEVVNFFRNLMCCSFWRKLDGLALARCLYRLSGYWPSSGWRFHYMLMFKIWVGPWLAKFKKKFLHVSIYLFWEYFISPSHKLYFSITRFINALHI